MNQKSDYLRTLKGNFGSEWMKQFREFHEGKNINRRHEWTHWKTQYHRSGYERVLRGHEYGVENKIGNKILDIAMP